MLFAPFATTMDFVGQRFNCALGFDANCGTLYAISIIHTSDQPLRVRLQAHNIVLLYVLSITFIALDGKSRRQMSNTASRTSA